MVHSTLTPSVMTLFITMILSMIHNIMVLSIMMILSMILSITPLSMIIIQHNNTS